MLKKRSVNHAELAQEEKYLWLIDTERYFELTDVPEFSKESLNKLFVLSIHHNNLKQADYLLQQSVGRPDQDVIDKLFREACREGSDPELIHFLQLHASQAELISEERMFSKSRRELLNQYMTQYLVGFLEHEKLKEIKERCDKYANRQSRRVLRGPMLLQAIFSDQLWINSTFFDCVHSLNKYAVMKLLGGDEMNLKPDQRTINNSFVHCLQNGRLSMAALLTGQRNHYQGGYYSGVDQLGYDEAFRVSVDSEVVESIGWMLSGRYGMVPTQAVVDEVYLMRRRLPPYQSAVRVRGTASAKKVREETRQANELRAAVLQVLAIRVSEEVQEKLRPQQRRHDRPLRRDDLMMEDDFDDNDEDDDGDGNDGNDDPQRAADRRRARLQRLIGRRNIGLGSESIYSYYDSRVNETTTAAAVAPTAATAAAPANGDVEPDWTQFHNNQAAATATPTTSLNQLVLQCMERRTGGVAYSRDLIVERMSNLIFETFHSEEEQTRAVHIVSAGMTEENIRLLGITLSFLESFPPEDVAVWIQGFLVESIVVNSCNPGAMKRIITGLRGIADPELNALFRQSEGPGLARIFLNNAFNIYHVVDTAASDGGAVASSVVAADASTTGDSSSSSSDAVRRAQQLAVVLVDRGITLASTQDQIAAALTSYAQESLTEYGVSLAAFERDIRMSVECVTDCYEDILEHYVRSELAKRVSSTDDTMEVVDEFVPIPPEHKEGFD